MAIIFNCPCGKDFNAKDDYAGKRARCPQCHREFRIPNQSTFGPVDMAISTMLAPYAPSNMPPALPIQVADDVIQRMDEATRTESASESRPVCAQPILFYGGGVPLLALLVFLGYVGWLNVPGKQASTAKPRLANETKGDVAPPAAKKSPPENFSDWMTSCILGTYADSKTVLNARVVAIDAQPMPPDARQVAGLWKVTANVTGMAKPEQSDPDQELIPVSYIWTSVVQRVPGHTQDAGAGSRLQSLA